MLGSLVGESQLSMPKFELLMEFSSFVPLVSLELEYHDELCALKSPSTRVSVVVSRWSRQGLYPVVQELVGGT